MVRTAIQLFTLRELGEPPVRLVERVGGTDFDGVEFAGLDDAEATSVERALSETGLAAAAAHVPVEELEADPEGVAETHRRLGCETLVVPYLGEEHFESERAVGETADRLAALADRVADAGGRLCYHNHDHELLALDGESAFERLLDETDDRLGIELDVGWVTAAGYDPVALLDRLAGRVPLVHLKDVDAATRTPVELGEGDVDVEACAAAARDAGTEWLIYEHDDPENPAASLEHGAHVLSSLR